MKAKIAALIFIALTIAGVVHARTKHIRKGHFNTTMTIRQGSIDQLYFSKLPHCEFVYIQHLNGEVADKQPVYAQRYNRDYHNRYFELDISGLEKGTYAVTAMACYQMWEMNLVMK